MTVSKFQLRSFDGTPVRSYVVDQKTVDTTGTPEPLPTHHVVLVDASGSMYYAMSGMTSLIRKVWTLGEFENASQLVSLYSYSGTGDLREHFSRVPLRDVMKADSQYLAEISGLRTRGLTCISQALEVIPSLLRDGEVTAVSLHSDGYANVPSPTRERQSIRAQLAQMKDLPNVYINTIAHSRSSDFVLLNEIANTMSGVCTQSTDLRGVYESLHNTTVLLESNTAPTLLSSLTGQYQTFVSKSARKALGASGDLSVRGLSADDDATFYQYREVTASEYETSSAPVCGEGSDLTPVYAYAAAQIAEGNLNSAKYALISTRNSDLISNHITALAGSDLAELVSAVTECVFSDSTSQVQGSYGLDTSQASVLAVLSVLDRYAGQWSIHLPTLKEGYRRRTVSKKTGSLNKETGEITLPETDTIFRDDGQYARVTSMSINSTGANANMTITRPITLVDRDSRDPISMVAGLDVTDLHQPQSYTVVGDGRLNVKSLRIRIADKRLFRALSKIGVVSGQFSATEDVTLDMTGRPMVEYSKSFDPADLEGVFEEVGRYKVFLSILSALKGKTKSASHTPDQIAELKAKGLTPALNVSYPTMNPYTDKDKALREGIIDTRIAYKVSLGSDRLASWSHLKSANEELKRRFAVKVDGKAVSSPKWDTVFWDPKATVEIKKLTARTKLTQSDDIAFPMTSAFLGLGNVSDLTSMLRGADPDLIEDFEEALKSFGSPESQDDALETFEKVSKHLQSVMDRLLNEMWIPVVFYVGCTGLVPDQYGAKALSYDEVVKARPNLKIASKEKDATFFCISDTCTLSVSMSEVLFTPTRS